MLVVHLHGSPLAGGKYRMQCRRCGMNRVCEHAEEMHYCGAGERATASPLMNDPGVGDGPGSELKALLKDWLGIEASPTCSCNAMARRMNERGPEWCESDEGMAEILGVMRAEHGKRWQAGATKLPWTDFGAKQLVRLACRRARAKASA